MDSNYVSKHFNVLAYRRTYQTHIFVYYSILKIMRFDLFCIALHCNGLKLHCIWISLLHFYHSFIIIIVRLISLNSPQTKNRLRSEKSSETSIDLFNNLKKLFHRWNCEVCSSSCWYCFSIRNPHAEWNEMFNCANVIVL